MKFVTYRGPEIPETQKSDWRKADVKIGKIFVISEPHHPLAPKGRLGFFMNDMVIDAAAASMKFVMRSDEKKLLSETLPPDIITFLSLGERAAKLAQDTWDWQTGGGVEELIVGFKFDWG